MCGSLSPRLPALPWKYSSKGKALWLQSVSFCVLGALGDASCTAVVFLNSHTCSFFRSFVRTQCSVYKCGNQ